MELLCSLHALSLQSANFMDSVLVCVTFYYDEQILLSTRFGTTDFLVLFLFSLEIAADVTARLKFRYMKCGCKYCEAHR